MSAVPGMVVVGGGECGARAASALREAGWSGPVTLVGAESVPPYERPPLSKSMMTGPPASPPTTICATETLRTVGIAFVAGVAATDIDRDRHEVVLATGQRIAYQRLLVATGATAYIAAAVTARHERAGVDVRCGTGVVQLDRHDGELLLELTTGETLVCDTVVVGIGAVPETSLARKAGLAVDNGVRVDTRLTTSDPDVFAAGDCCSWPHPLYDGRRIRLESWRNAQDQGGAAARNMLGADEPFTTVPWFWSDQYELTLQIAGLPDAATAEVVRRRPDGVEIRFGLGPDGRLLSASAVGTGNAVAQDIRLAELLIARRATPSPETLADPTAALKALLKQCPR